MLQQQYYEKKRQKKKAEQQAPLLNALYTDAKKIAHVDEQSEDQDPANTVCPYFKQGLCDKGKKCIYSHDFTFGRTQQIGLYVDQRTQLIMNAIGGKQLSQLSQDQLNKILGQKQKQMMKGTRSKIVCKHFLEAAEKDKYDGNGTVQMERYVNKNIVCLQDINQKKIRQENQKYKLIKFLFKNSLMNKEMNF